MTKKKWKRRALVAEAELLTLRIPEMTYQTLMVDFVARSVTWQGRTIHSEAACLSMPVLFTADL